MAANSNENKNIIEASTTTDTPELKNKTAAEAFSSKLLSSVYIVLAWIGFFSLKELRILKRAMLHLFGRIASASAKTGRRIRAYCARAAKAAANAIKKPFLAFSLRVSAAWARLLQSVKNGPAAFLREIAYSLVRLFDMMMHAFLVLLRIAVPAGAVAVLCLTVSYYNNLEYGLVMDYSDDISGFVEDKNVFGTAEDMIASRLMDDVTLSAIVEGKPSYRIAEYKGEDLITAEELSTDLILASDFDVVEATGVYVDNVFLGATDSIYVVKTLIDNRLDEYRTGNPTEQISIYNDIRFESGFYPESSICPVTDITDVLSSQTAVEKTYTLEPGDSPYSVSRKFDLSISDFNELNPDAKFLVGEEVLISQAQNYLQVLVTREEVYEESIPYKTVRNEDRTLYKGNQTTKQAGKNGSQMIDANITYIDGAVVNRDVISAEVIAEPVDRVIAIGTKPVYTASRGAVNKSYPPIPGGENLVFPVPGYKYISSNFGWRTLYGKPNFHTGTDFAADYNTPIYAAAAGTVKVAMKKTTGYGWHIIIDHGNGVQTVYAHCNALLVQPGQKVGQGDAIALVGRTGNATGPHLHFEVRINGEKKNPLNYVKPFKW